jgi:lysophospholipase L1-like esterase
MLSSYMFIFKKNYFKFHLRKNKAKNYLRYFLYFFIFLFCITVTSLCSCSSLTRKTEKIASGIPFNYPGLRIETRGVSFEDISNNYPRIVCFGDSVTFGWNIRYDLSYPYLLGKNLEGKYPGVKVINCGVGGNTVTDALARIEKDVLSYKPHLVIINFGLNDGMLKKQEGSNQPISGSLYFKKDSTYFLPQVNISDFDEKYRHIIGLLKNNNISVIVLGINPVNDNFPAGQQADFRKKQKDIYLVYNERIRKIAAENTLDFLSIWEIFSSQRVQDEYLQPDGIHPNEAGQGLISESVFKYITGNNILNRSDNVQN